ncbi:nuclear transport factor 2 family protein [Micromonospora fluostatini]|uniref:nuclear transport factor 2 family protein n=1 Tax=Micromonospora sp. JCM 30529 TaxID=3421643 RepID=UPI003D169A93
MSSHGGARPTRSTAVTAAGVDHVRLSYHYLDTGDIDAYGSLLDEHVQVRRPDLAQGRGRAEVLRTHAQVAGPPARHQIYKVIADGDGVAVTGRYTGSVAPHPGQQPDGELDFVDVFTLTDEGMLLGYRRYYFVAPEPDGWRGARGTALAARGPDDGTDQPGVTTHPLG